MSGIYFSYADAKFNYNRKRQLQSFIGYVFGSEGIEVDKVHFIFCSDSYLLDINQQYLQHDYLTDIITFDLSSDLSNVIGEVYVSVDRVKDNANVYNVSFFDEMLRVLIHGALHLCGYDDKSVSETIVMREKESCYIHMFHR